MTKIIISHFKNGLDIAVIGHAAKINEGPVNLLCCAISILGQTLAKIAMDMDEVGKIDAAVKIESGLIRVRARFKDDEAEFKTKAEAIEEGFRLLKNEYPDLIFMEGEIRSRR